VRNQRGEGKLGVIIWLAFLAAGVFAAVRIVPMKIAVMELHDFADSQVQLAGATSQVHEGKLADSIVSKARSLNLPVERKQLKLEVGPNEIRLRMAYEVHVNLEVYDWLWKMDDTFSHMRM
jgi:hypothetical protein